MNETEIRDMREIAAAATPGPWEIGDVVNRGTGDEIVGCVTSVVPGTGQVIVTDSGEYTTAADAKFIAAANPATILGLLDVLEATREMGDHFRGLVRSLGHFITTETADEPGDSENTVDCAIRVIRDLQRELAKVVEERDRCRRELDYIGPVRSRLARLSRAGESFVATFDRLQLEAASMTSAVRSILGEWRRVDSGAHPIDRRLSDAIITLSQIHALTDPD